MLDVLKETLHAPVGNLFVVFGLLLVALAVVGKVSGKLEPDRAGRIASGVVGAALIFAGLAIHSRTHRDMPPVTSDVSPAPPHKQADQPKPVPTVAVLRPGEGAEVPRKTVVAGSVKAPDPTTGFYWIVLQDDDGDLYSVRRISVQSEGHWEEPLMFGPAWSGRTAYVLVCHASAAGDSALEQATRSGVGLDMLPQGVQTVVRRKVQVQ
jgi:hypothetical protein